VVPSLGLVVMRLGENPRGRLRGVQAAEADRTQLKFDNQLWQKMMVAIQPTMKKTLEKHSEDP
jgi:hypothetical protein